MTAKANVKRGPRTDLGSITIQQNREEGLGECTQDLEEWLVGAWRGWTGGRGYAHSRGSWKLFLQRWGWGEACNRSSYEWEVRRWRPALQKVSLNTGARAEPARNGVFVALSALVPGMGKEGVALCCEK